MSNKPSQILGYLYLGGRSDAKSKETVDALNVKYILNCTPPKSLDPETGCPNYFQKDKTYHYLRIPVFDNIGENISSQFDSTFKFIEEGKHYGNVLVHCHKGVSRSASFVIAYLMRKNELSFDEAPGFVKGIRPVVQPNESFVAQLSKYCPQGDIGNSKDNVETQIVGNLCFDVCLPAKVAVEIDEEHLPATFSSSQNLNCIGDNLADPVADKVSNGHDRKRVKHC